MDFDARVRAAIYAWIVEATDAPSTADLADVFDRSAEEVREAYGRLFRKRVLFLEPDGETIRMAPPFSAVPTQHRVRVGETGRTSPTARGTPWESRPRCTRRGRSSPAASRRSSPIHLRVGREGPEPETVVAHFAVPAAKWWADLVYT